MDKQLRLAVTRRYGKHMNTPGILDVEYALNSKLLMDRFLQSHCTKSKLRGEKLKDVEMFFKTAGESAAKIILDTINEGEIATEEAKKYVRELMDTTRIEDEPNNYSVNEIFRIIDKSKLQCKPLCEIRGDVKKWDGLKECKKKKHEYCLCSFPSYLGAIGSVDGLKKMIELLDKSWDYDDEEETEEPEEKNGLTIEEKAAKKAKSMEGKIADYESRIENNNEKITDIEERAGEMTTEARRVKEGTSYKGNLGQAYGIADRLFSAVSNSSAMRKDLGMDYVPTQDECGLREIRNAILAYCQKTGSDPNRFIDGAIAGDCSQNVLGAISMLTEYAYGYSQHVQAGRIMKDFTSEIKKVEGLLYENEVLTGKITAIKERLGNGTAA